MNVMPLSDSTYGVINTKDQIVFSGTKKECNNYIEERV